MIQKLVLLFTIISVLLFNACDKPEPELIEEDVILSPTELPGAVTTIDGDTLDTSEDSAVLLYFWIPLPDYDMAEGDFLLLDSLSAEGLHVVPVQFDNTSRHIGQFQLQAIGSTLQVYMGSNELADFTGNGSLPVSILCLPGKVEFRADGHGSPVRVIQMSGFEISPHPVHQADSSSDTTGVPALEETTNETSVSQ